MKKRIFMYCNRASSSAARLANAIGATRIKRVGSKYRQKPDDIVINYGCSDCGDIKPTIQPCHGVVRATSKMKTFTELKDAGIPVPEWTKDKELAQGWLGKGKVLGRDVDRGSQGRGIHVYPKGHNLEDHLFYVRYVKKEREFRYHVAFGKVIHISEKLKVNPDDRGVNFDPYIRSHNKGWVLAFNHLADKPPPKGGEEVAVRVCDRLHLSFCAVDMAWSAAKGFTVLEANSAPGIEETTLDKYAEAFNAYCM